uniref:PEROXIDASE_4 domain-containing protein n=1 Tax=Haemonchus placei TaxID=6290 RepID=A0A0N4X3W7_HAEPC
LNFRRSDSGVCNRGSVDSLASSLAFTARYDTIKKLIIIGADKLTFNKSAAQMRGWFSSNRNGR